MTIGAQYVGVTNGMVQYCFETSMELSRDVKFLDSFPEFGV